MKGLLVLPLVLLTVCVIADERIIFGSIERDLTKEDFNTLGVDIETTITLNGFGARSFNFKDNGLYHGDAITFLTGERQACLAGTCNAFDATKLKFSGEMGIALGQWIPFAGMSFALSRVEFETDTDRKVELTKGLIAGFWFELDTFVLRSALTNLDDEDNRAISGGFLLHMDNNIVLGGEFGLLLNSKVDGFSVSLQIGRSF